jgi:2-polyprenyl-6-methoxyphenol hydroxylase-like FAD-dependent oxidoreductase
MKVLISGASVAGPALAYWLARGGCDVTVVERAPGPRLDGYSVDFRGETHMAVLGRMGGVLKDLEAVQTYAGAMRFVDTSGRTRSTFPRSLPVAILRCGDRTCRASCAITAVRRSASTTATA